MRVELELAQHRRALVAYCYRLTGSLHEAEDLAQEALLRAWQRRDSLTEPALLRAWLYRIATNACLDRVKSPRAREAALDDVSVLDAETSGPEARYSHAQSVSRAFVATLNRLSPKHRALVLLRDVLGWSARETAQALEMSEPAVHSALARARAALEEPAAARERLSPRATGLFRRVFRAWQERNVGELVALLAVGVTVIN